MRKGVISSDTPGACFIGEFVDLALKFGVKFALCVDCFTLPILDLGFQQFNFIVLQGDFTQGIFELGLVYQQFFFDGLFRSCHFRGFPSGFVVFGCREMPYYTP